MIQALRARYVDLETASEAGLLGHADDLQLQYATAHGHIIFTFNRGDYYHLHAAWLSRNRHHSGIIISDQLGTGIVMRRLLRLIDAKSVCDMHD